MESKMATKIDMHIHSTCSDGSLSPENILKVAHKNGVKILSITDHDSVSAYTPQFLKKAEQYGISVINGCEMSTKINGVGFHVLGYNMDLKNENLLKTLDMLQNARVNYVYDVSKVLQKIGYIMNPEDIKDAPSVGKPHVTKNILTNPENHNKLISDFGHIPNVGEFIETILNEGCPAFVEKFHISPNEAVKVIKSAGGTAVLAHPVAYIYQDGVSRDEIVELVKNMNPDGIESYYLFTESNGNEIDESAFWTKFSKDKNLLCTIGSDYHDSWKGFAEIGFSNRDFSIPDKDLERIISRFKQAKEKLHY